MENSLPNPGPRRFANPKVPFSSIIPCPVRLPHRPYSLHKNLQHRGHVLVNPTLAVVQHNHQQLRRRPSLLLRLSRVFQDTHTHVHHHVGVPAQSRRYNSSTIHSKYNNVYIFNLPAVLLLQRDLATTLLISIRRRLYQHSLPHVTCSHSQRFPSRTHPSLC